MGEAWGAKRATAALLLWRIGQSDSTLRAQASVIISKHRLDFNLPPFVFFIQSVVFKGGSSKWWIYFSPSYTIRVSLKVNNKSSINQVSC